MATVFTADKPEAAASRLCKARWCFSGRGLVCLMQHSCWQQEYLVTVFGTGTQFLIFFPPIFYSLSSEIFGYELILCDANVFFSVVLLL